MNVRLLLKKIAGEETPAKYEFKPSLITQEELRKVQGVVNTTSLKNVVRGWGENDDFEEDWMKELKESHVKSSLVKKVKPSCDEGLMGASICPIMNSLYYILTL